MTLGLDAAIRALAAAQLGLQTAGQNIANANTPGYSRQRIILAAASPFTVQGGLQIGTGVAVKNVQAIVDANLEAQLRMQMSLSGQAGVDFSRWNAIETVFNEPNGGLSTQLSDFFDQITQLQTNPEQRPQRNGLIQAASSMAVNFNLLANRIDSMTGSVLQEVGALTRDVNQLSTKIASLNSEILSSEANGSRANDLRDQREQAVKLIAETIDVRAFERSNGTVDVILDGAALVRGDSASQLRASGSPGGLTQLIVGRAKQEVSPNSGKIAALLAHERTGGAQVLDELDRMAKGLALEFNRLHTTGVPLAGSFSTLTSHYAVQDTDGDGERGDEILAQANLPFEVEAGDLYVTVTDKKTGATERSRIAIDPGAMTLDDLATALTGVDHLAASVDPAGRLRVSADVGFGFDFANRLDAQPDSFGTFGGASPSIGSAAPEPFDLTASFAAGPATFTVTVDGTAQAISINASEFPKPGAATAEQVAAAINKDLGTTATVKAVGGRVVIRSNSSGQSATLDLTDGSGAPLAALGLPAGAPQTGQGQGVDPQVFGKYTGTTNGQLVFVPDGDGKIGVTDSLTVGVFDTGGNRVATLDVGRGYAPGDHIEVADGVVVAFNPGDISASSNDVFAVDTLADSDTTDVLVALGMNSLFHGTTAADLSVSAALEANSDLLATGLSGAPGDPDNVVRMIQLRSATLGQLDSQSLEDFYNGVVGDVGFQTAAASASLDAQSQLTARLQDQRESVSGVNLDEEAVDMLRFQQAFEAASRYIAVVNRITDTLMNLVR